MPLYFQENSQSGRKLSLGNPFRNSMAEKKHLLTVRKSRDKL